MSWGANHVPQAPRRDPTVAAFRRADAAERRRRRDTLELLLREAKGFSMVADRMNLPSKPAIDRCAGRLQRLLRSLDAADASRDRDNARKAIDAYALEAEDRAAFSSLRGKLQSAATQMGFTAVDTTPAQVDRAATLAAALPWPRRILRAQADMLPATLLTVE